MNFIVWNVVSGYILGIILVLLMVWFISCGVIPKDVRWYRAGETCDSVKYDCKKLSTVDHKDPVVVDSVNIYSPGW